MATAAERQAQLAAVADSMDGQVAPFILGEATQPIANLGVLTQFAAAPTRKTATVKRQHTGPRPVLIMQPMGIIAAPGANGHCYFEVAPPTADNVAPADAAFIKQGEIGMRDNFAAGTGGSGFTGGVANLAPSGAPFGVVRPGGWYRMTTEQINGYNEPTWVYVAAPTFITL